MRNVSIGQLTNDRGLVVQFVERIIVEFRKFVGLSQQRLANELGVSVASLRKWEKEGFFEEKIIQKIMHLDFLMNGGDGW